jgi:hypothetical protein
MRTLVTIVFLIVETFHVYGQTRFGFQTITNAGEKSSYTGGSFTWTLGELSVGTISGTNIVMLQGFAPTTFYTIPDAPVALPANPVTGTSFTANWNSSANATGYRLDVAADNGFTLILTDYNNINVNNLISYSITGLSANTNYYLRIRSYNASGQSENSNIITVRTLPSAPTSVSAYETDICTGSSTFLSYIGGAGTTFFWYTKSCGEILVGTGNNLSVSLSTTTTYFGRWENSSGSSTCKTITITVHKPFVPFIAIKWNEVLVCHNNADSITAYQWFNGLTPINGATKQYYLSGKQQGLYKVQITDKNGCKSFSNDITISGTKSLAVYPNPTGEEFTLVLNDAPIGRTVIELLTESGIKIKELVTEKSSAELHQIISVTDLKEGSYILKVLVNNYFLYYLKLVVIK